MSIEIWLAFTLAATIILVIPGPTIILVISQAVTHGRRAVVPLAVGVMCGDFTAMTLSLLGLGAILAASAALFVTLKWVGALYLIYLGIRLWCARPHPAGLGVGPGRLNNRSLFKRAYIVTALNPKAIAFFVAFMPQFINHREPTLNQFFVLGATFLVLGTLNAALYAFFAGQLRDLLLKSRIARWFQRLGAGALIGAGIVTAAMKRAA